MSKFTFYICALLVPAAQAFAPASPVRATFVAQESVALSMAEETYWEGEYIPSFLCPRTYHVQDAFHQSWIAQYSFLGFVCILLRRVWCFAARTRSHRRWQLGQVVLCFGKLRRTFGMGHPCRCLDPTQEWYVNTKVSRSYHCPLSLKRESHISWKKEHDCLNRILYADFSIWVIVLHLWLATIFNSFCQLCGP